MIDRTSAGRECAFVVVGNPAKPLGDNGAARRPVAADPLARGGPTLSALREQPNLAAGQLRLSRRQDLSPHEQSAL